MQIAQTAACNRLHDIEQRLARWLLMTQDRVDSAELAITHDFVATMMGTDRSTVSLAAEDCEPQKTRKIRLRVLRRNSAIRGRPRIEITKPPDRCSGS